QAQLAALAGEYGHTLPHGHHHRHHRHGRTPPTMAGGGFRMPGGFGGGRQAAGMGLGGLSGGGGSGGDGALWSGDAARGHHVLVRGDGSLGSQAVNYATEKLGLMYKWGGKGGPRDGGRVDCSGLIHYAYSRLGIDVGADTYTQVTRGVQVSPNDIRPGDAIYCNWGEGGRPGPGHVVMATGYGPHSRIIEASHDGAPVAFGSMPSGHIVVKRFVP
ncbi:C40 family peptidase, partial [Mycobacterium avium]